MDNNTECRNCGSKEMKYIEQYGCGTHYKCNDCRKESCYPFECELKEEYIPEAAQPVVKEELEVSLTIDLYNGNDNSLFMGTWDEHEQNMNVTVRGNKKKVTYFINADEAKAMLNHLRYQLSILYEPAAQPVDSSHSQDKAMADWHSRRNMSRGITDTPDPSHSDKDIQGLQSANPNEPNYIMLANVSTTAGEFDNRILKAWEQIEIWYGDPQKEITAKELLIRISQILYPVKAAQSSPVEAAQLKEKCKHLNCCYEGVDNILCPDCNKKFTYEEWKKSFLVYPVEAAQPQQPKVRYDWQKDFYKEMNKYYPRAEYIPEIKDSVDEFQKFVDQLYGAKEQPSGKVLQAEELLQELFEQYNLTIREINKGGIVKIKNLPTYMKVKRFLATIQSSQINN